MSADYTPTCRPAHGQNHPVLKLVRQKADIFMWLGPGLVPDDSREIGCEDRK
jgi:hypothetical protein